MKKRKIPTAISCLLIAAAVFNGCSADFGRARGIVTTESVRTDVDEQDQERKIETEQKSEWDDGENKKADQDAEIGTEDSVPTEYRSALNKAYSYSDMMHMSKAGIYDQLTSEYGEKFTKEAAQYAIDHVEIDWKENALVKAKEYSDTMYMSKAGVYNQLISEYGERFTEEEAQYAIDHVEADWNTNALAKAESYQEMDMSPAAIYDQLISEYGEQFTEAEAQYAIDHLN